MQTSVEEASNDPPPTATATPHAHDPKRSPEGENKHKRFKKKSGGEMRPCRVVSKVCGLPPGGGRVDPCCCSACSCSLCPCLCPSHLCRTHASRWRERDRRNRKAGARSMSAWPRGLSQPQRSVSACTAIKSPPTTWFQRKARTERQASPRIGA